MRIPFYIFLLWLIAVTTANAQDIVNDYKSLSTNFSSKTLEGKDAKGLVSPPELLLVFYQKIISPQDNTSCLFHPSCSEFSRQAIRTKGIINGYVLTFDRLQRCNGLPGMYQAYPLDENGEYFLDPVENYTSSK
ncbi:MAG: membrane protein insertion efficiency factor YidD [Balneolales bacterium]